MPHTPKYWSLKDTDLPDNQVPVAVFVYMESMIIRN